MNPMMVRFYFANIYISIEVLILWKEVLCSYSLSFLSKKDRDYVLYEYGGITTFLEDEFTLRRMK